MDFQWTLQWSLAWVQARFHCKSGILFFTFSKCYFFDEKKKLRKKLDHHIDVEFCQESIPDVFRTFWALLLLFFRFAKYFSKKVTFFLQNIENVFIFIFQTKNYIFKIKIFERKITHKTGQLWNAQIRNLSFKLQVLRKLCYSKAVFFFGPKKTTAGERTGGAL